MKKIVMTLVVLLLSACAASAATKQKWTAGWDNFSEPLNYSKSNVTWSVSSATRKLTLKFNLVGANPNKIYQMSIHFFCTTFPANFGQFPTDGGGGACQPITRQGVTKNIAAVEFGVVTTDMNGNGTFSVVVGPVASGTYSLEFVTRNGTGCNLTGGAGNDACYDDCAADFQSPGPFGTATTITVP